MIDIYNIAIDDLEKCGLKLEEIKDDSDGNFVCTELGCGTLTCPEIPDQC